MMNQALLLATASGLGFSAGINAYATLLVYGLLARFFPGIESAGEMARFFASTPVLAALAFLFLVEFIADKIPAVDHIWDAVHTVVRPLAGAVAALAVSSSLPQGWQVLAAAAAGSLALASHSAKAGTRVASTALTGGSANWILSLLEDVLAVVQAVLSIFLPAVALLSLLLLLILVFIVWRRWHRQRLVPASS